MFGRGNWAVLGLAKESLEAFKTILGNQTLMVGFSQMAASSAARHLNVDAIGINPYHAPRLDDENPLDLELQGELAAYTSTEQEARAELALPEDILNAEGYSFNEESFRIHPTMPWYGLWAVLNEWKAVSDLSSIKEQRSYIALERPYKFLQNTDKKTVDRETIHATRPIRTQVPVLLDFNEGRVYVENTNKKLIYQIIVRLQLLGAEILPVAWMFPRPNWTSAILNQLYENTQYQSDFLKRAEEAKRFTPKEIEKLDDREIEAIVSDYFSMTQLPSELWVGISTPAQIRLQDTSPPIGVKAPTSATTLLHVTNDAGILTGALTFQERIAVTTKDGSERTFRKDLFCLDVNDRINLTDVGAAMLRGFNLPNWKKDLQREIKQTQQVPTIEQFWGHWLHELSLAVRTIEASFREILDIDGNEPAGIVQMATAPKEENSELVSA